MYLMAGSGGNTDLYVSSLVINVSLIVFLYFVMNEYRNNYKSNEMDNNESKRGGVKK